MLASSVRLADAGVAPARAASARAEVAESLPLRSLPRCPGQVAELQLQGGEQLTLLHTHLTFPHKSLHDPVMRRQQARKLSEVARSQPAACCVFGERPSDTRAVA